MIEYQNGGGKWLGGTFHEVLENYYDTVTTPD